MTVIDSNDMKAFAIGFVLCYIISVLGYIHIHQYAQLDVWLIASIIPSMFVGVMVMICGVCYREIKR